ncbi:hypothetical protein ACFVVU_22875 [Kitasatospora sp. NPDC057965]|uniref:hypothetical protein n=1 Tax=Kitasatospora sp. NPDC057965 TaxID=3346291 RepID=UPI0036D8B815
MNPHRSIAAWSAGLLASVLLSACGGAPEPRPASPIDGRTYSALQTLESALGEQGRADFKDTFGALQLDPAGRHVILFATDEGRARTLIEAAAAAHPGIETSHTLIRKCRYSRGTVDPALDRIAAAAESNRLPAPVHSVAMLPDGSGIKVATTKAGATSKELKDAVAELAAGISVSYEESPPIVSLDATATMSRPT